MIPYVGSEEVLPAYSLWTWLPCTHHEVLQLTSLLRGHRML